jgi:polyphosphate kinase 2 (PPK2 family)
MGQLDDLRTPLEDLTHDQLIERIGEIRDDRKISKHAVTMRKARSNKTVSKTAKKVADLTAEEKAELIAVLEAMDDGD